MYARAVLAAIDNRVYPAEDNPQELEAARLIVELHRSISVQQIVTLLNQSFAGAARSGHWHGRTVRSVIRRHGGPRSKNRA